jgi:hypothetical protein
MARHVKRRIGVHGARGRSLLCALALLAVLPEGALGDDTSPGMLLRRARFALAAGRVEDAAGALREVVAREPGSRRGLEAALMLADAEFARGRGGEADAVLTAAETRFPDGDASGEILLARGWLAVARQDPAAATRHFGLVASRTSHRFATELAALGGAWARLVVQQRPADVPAELRTLAASASDPALRVAAALTLARAHAARAEHKRALRKLRALRRAVRGTSFSDDVELAIGLSQLDMGSPAAARKTFTRLARLSGTSPASAGAPVSGLTIDDLRLAPQAFAARLARLYAARKDRTGGVLPFFAATLDRPAAADAAAALALADAALAARKEV